MVNVRIDDHVPAEMVQEILARFPITSIFENKYVCQSWRSLINDPLLANMHFIRASLGQIPSTHLLLTSFEGSDDDNLHVPPEKIHFVVDIKSLISKPIYNNELYTRPNMDICNKPVKLNINIPFNSSFLVGSCNGFLCFKGIQDDESSLAINIWVYNPVTGECIKLILDHDSSTSNEIVGMGFGFDSKSKYFKLVKMHRYHHISEDKRKKEDGLEFAVHSVMTTTTNLCTSWTATKNIHLKATNPLGRCWVGILVNECLHGLVRDNNDNVGVVAVSLADEDLQQYLPPQSIFVLPENYDGWEGKGRHIALGELGGRLIMIEPCHEKHIDVWVMKEYGNDKSWAKEFVIDLPSYALCYFSFKILLIQDNGNLLLSFGEPELFSYDPRSRSFKDVIEFRPGINRCFLDVYLHVPTFAWLKHNVELCEDEDEQGHGHVLSW